MPALLAFATPSVIAVTDPGRPKPDSRQERTTQSLVGSALRAFEGEAEMQARQLMTAEPACCTPEDTIREAAQLMREHDCGCVPVVEDRASNRLVGVVTDRDIACRCTAEGKGPDTPVQEAMSRDPKCCGPEDDVEQVEKIMGEEQVRRVPVVDARGCCVGIVAQADLALDSRAASDDVVGKVVEQISVPADPASWAPAGHAG